MDLAQSQSEDVSVATERAQSRVVTIPNALSALRIIGVPLFVWLILGPEAYEWAVAVLVVSSATDWFDGYLARKLNQTSRIGQLLDPIADRLYIVAALVSLLITDIVPIWLVVAFLLRDALLLATGPLLLRKGYSSLAVNSIGKSGAGAMLIAIPMLLWGASGAPLHDALTAIAWGFALWGVALYWLAGVLYLMQLTQILRGRLPAAPQN